MSPISTISTVSDRPVSDRPVSDRRPIADVFRRSADAAVRFCVDRGIHPNTISYASIVAATAAAGSFALASHGPGLLILGTVLCVVRLWLNMLDGMVAVASDRCSPWGAVVNELPDRVSDVVIFAGLAVGGLCRPELALTAAVASVFVAYVGTLGQAVGGGRGFEGWMSKPHRMVVVGVGALWTWRLLTVPFAESHVVLGALPWTALDFALALVIVGCVHTAWIRLRCLRHRLRAQEGSPS